MPIPHRQRKVRCDVIPVFYNFLLSPFRLVRDQAEKTFDIYITRIRKYGSSLPDTAIAPPSGASANGVAPRIGTAQSDTSWAGWAISSFTNKLALASGEMQAKPSPAQSDGLGMTRSPSAPVSLSNGGIRPSLTTTASELQRQALAAPLAPPLQQTIAEPLTTESRIEEFELDNPWGEVEEDSFLDATSSQKSPSPPMSFDDGGEPDFAGWLNAQAQAKSKKPLPKGLSKPSTSNKGTVSAKNISLGSSNISTAVRKPITAEVKPKAQVSSVIDTKPKEPTGDDDWGEAWA